MSKEDDYAHVMRPDHTPDAVKPEGRWGADVIVDLLHGHFARRPALGVVDHHLDLGEAAGRLALAAGEDHVPHLLAADAEGLCSPSAQRPRR